LLDRLSYAIKGAEIINLKIHDRIVKNWTRYDAYLVFIKI